MPVRRWFRLTLATCLFSAVGCQSMSPDSWKFWQKPENASRTQGLKDPVRTHVAYGHLQEQNGNLNEARESYEIALKQDAKSADATLGLARLDLLGGRPKEAEKKFDQALAMAPQNAHVLEAIGQFYITQERYQDAARLLDRGVQADPNNRKLRFQLAVATARSGDIRGAEPHFVQAVGAAEADYNIGLILYESGKLAQADQHLQRALHTNPKLAQAEYWLNEIRSEMGTAPAQGSSPNAGLVQDAPVPTPGGGGPLPSSAGTSPLTPFSSPLPPLSSSIAGPVNPVPTQPARTLDPSSMSAAQLEQYENSLTPADRERLRNQLRIGQAPLGYGPF